MILYCLMIDDKSVEEPASLGSPFYYFREESSHPLVGLGAARD